MKLTRATYFLAGLLVAMGHQGLMAQDRSLSRVLFENDDFKVYSVRNPDLLPSISEPATFGVAFLKGREPAYLRNTSGLPFSGSSGRQSVLVYGTPEGVIPFIDKERFLNAGADLIWVVPKFKAEITEPVFRPGLPDSFTKSVRDDLFSIGSIADSAAAAQPSKTELARARAAIDDLSFKSRWFSFFSNTSSAPSLVCVTARTLKEGKEINHWTVWYVLVGWEGDKDHTMAFDKQSSPTNPQCIPPGNYKMWASQRERVGTKKPVSVGDNPSKSKEVDLEVP